MNFRLPSAKARIQSQVNVCEISEKWKRQSFFPCNSGFLSQCYWSNAPYLFADFDPTLVRRTSVRSPVTCYQSGTLSDIGEALNSKALSGCRLLVVCACL